MGNDVPAISPEHAGHTEMPFWHQFLPSSEDGRKRSGGECCVQPSACNPAQNFTRLDATGDLRRRANRGGPQAQASSRQPGQCRKRPRLPRFPSTSPETRDVLRASLIHRRALDSKIRLPVHPSAHNLLFSGELWSPSRYLNRPPCAMV